MAKGVAEHKGKDGGRCLVGPRAGESGRLVDGEAVVIVAGMLPGDGDEYILTEGGMKGQRGFFTRDNGGTVVGVDLAGRLFRVPTASR